MTGRIGHYECPEPVVLMAVGLLAVLALPHAWMVGVTVLNGLGLSTVTPMASRSSDAYLWPLSFVFAVFSILALLNFVRSKQLLAAVVAIVLTAITYAIVRFAEG